MHTTAPLFCDQLFLLWVLMLLFPSSTFWLLLHVTTMTRNWVKIMFCQFYCASTGAGSKCKNSNVSMVCMLLYIRCFFLCETQLSWSSARISFGITGVSVAEVLSGLFLTQFIVLLGQNVLMLVLAVLAFKVKISDEWNAVFMLILFLCHTWINSYSSIVYTEVKR